MNIELEGVSMPLKPTASILAVDDVPENLELLAEVLSEEGYRVVTSRSGMEALELLRRDQIHLIIADAMMPKMDGLELCKQVRSNLLLPKVPFIIYTGNYIDNEDQELAREIGVDKYVMKSDGVQVLAATVSDLLRKRYGFTPEDFGDVVSPIDDQAFLERHHTIVTKKLEDKMKELQQYAETLARKNRELTISELRVRGLFENAAIAIFVLDHKVHRIAEVNKQGAILLGLKKEEILLLSTLPFASTQTTIPDLYNAQEPFAGEAILQMKNGSFIAVDVAASPLYELDDSLHTLVFVRDITEQKKMREQLLQSEKMSTMGHIAAGIAHEIRNPLAGILLNLQYLDRHLPQGTPDLESVQAALEGVHRVQQVIEDTLGLARVAPPLFHEDLLNPLIEKSLLYLKLVLRHKSISVHKHLSPNLPLVLIDTNQIQQVLLNIIQNAADACPENGSIEITSEVVTFATDPSRRCIEVRVHDSGTGVTQDVLDHLFEPFHTTKSDGTGLGLMLSKYILDRHQGFISVCNGHSTGAIVRVQIPIQTKSIER
jgi:two-component system, cell cycle sensor histidine kinase and response regulator CckA